MALRRGLVIALALLAFLALAVPAGAVLSGENGRIVFVSGRTGADNDDTGALVYFLPVPFSSGGGTVSAPVTPSGGQYRHPTWSPDRTKIAWANGIADNNPATQDFDIAIQDLVANTITFITNTGDSLSADRPAWSPDGTRIAYEAQPADPGNDSTDRDIRVQTVGTAAPPLILASSTDFEGKPAWTPNSQTIYYAKNDGGDLDIVSEPADNSGTPTTVLGPAGSDQFQPSISPDGTKMCYTNQSTPGSTATADVLIVNIPVAGVSVPISNVAAVAEYNCTWSPDGQKIAYVSGAFTGGALVMADSDGLGSGPDTLTDDAGNFDGNPDWAPDGRPDCPDSTVSTPANTPITIQLECTDTGPAYERTDPNGFVANDGAPANGTTSDDAPLDNPSTVKYTPNQGFTGTDSLKFTSFDGFGFGTDRGTVTINVTPPPTGPGPGPVPEPPKCGGRTATIVGTAARNTLVGTTRRDVIVGLGGNDTIRSGRGNDLVCGGAGGDRVSGGPGNDNLQGNTGNDRIGGGSGRDRLSGGSGRDRLNGGSARDRCTGGPGRDRGASCERSSGIP